MVFVKKCNMCNSYMLPVKADEEGQHWKCPVCGCTKSRTVRIITTDNTTEETRKDNNHGKT